MVQTQVVPAASSLSTVIRLGSAAADSREAASDADRYKGSPNTDSLSPGIATSKIVSDSPAPPFGT